MNSFPQLRKDPIVDRWVLIAPERGRRPVELAGTHRARTAEWCPFCEGEESRTPPEILAIRRSGSQPNKPGWRVRVVPNIFPAARRDAPPNAGAEQFCSSTGYGVHEVVVESPRHESSIGDLSQDQLRMVFSAYRARLIELESDVELQYVQVFKNHGAGAGATVEHVHSQILGLPRIPRELTAELAGSTEHLQRTGRCAYCDLIEREWERRDRVILADEHIVAIAAYAGRFPYETWILPRHHTSHFHRTEEFVVSAVADTIGTLLRRLGKCLDNPSYNLVLHTSPLHDGERPDYHWHWELLPRVTGIAGFELASGWFINPVPPELAAEKLRG